MDLECISIEDVCRDKDRKHVVRCATFKNYLLPEGVKLEITYIKKEDEEERYRLGSNYYFNLKRDSSLDHMPDDDYEMI